MNSTQLIVIVFGLVLGYWIVSTFFLKRDSGVTRQTKSTDDAAKNIDGESDTDSWYSVLDVPSNASIEEIRQAYKLLMSQYHPDKVSLLGKELQSLAEKKSKAINKAYTEAIRQRGEAV